MSNVVTITAKTLASKRRVSAMADKAVLYLNREHQEQERAREVGRLRKMVLDELEMSIRKVYAVLGTHAETAVTLVHSKVKE